MISHILSFTDVATLRNAACVSRMMQLEAERYIYSSLSIFSEDRRVIPVIINNSRRLSNVKHLVVGRTTWSAMDAGLLYLLPNLTHLTTEDTINIAGLRPYPFKLKRLQCPSIDQSFLMLIVTQPSVANNIAELDLFLPPVHPLPLSAFPTLDTLTTTVSVLRHMVGRPLTKIRILGTMTEMEFICHVVPILLSFTRPITQLSVTINDITTQTLTTLATRLPYITHLRLSDCAEPEDERLDAGGLTNPDTNAVAIKRNQMSGWTKALASLPNLMHFEYQGEEEKPWARMFGNGFSWAEDTPSICSIRYLEPRACFVRLTGKRWLGGTEAHDVFQGLESWLVTT